MESKRLGKISLSQKNYLIEFIRENSQLVTSKFSNHYTYKDDQKLWMEVTENLNSIPGAKKWWMQWRKTRHDIQTKSKKAANIEHQNRTSGGAQPQEMLTKEDESIVGILSPITVGGNVENNESNAEFYYDLQLTDNIEIEYKDSIPSKANLEREEDKEETTQQEKVKPKFSSKGKGNMQQQYILATTALTNAINKKIEIKEKYYNSKLEILRKQTQLFERMVEAISNLKNNE
ncbi:hypothetical protein RN001_006118 [Aquatica leii]|uniref:Regulatory protein zeste n=1 Tax=Aquatica leii TaxID=1421715 RepID=A0AAN7Q1D8_9COLE|nr:hypothetical protein RN001_006118 [Aquatica leii]